MNSYLIAKTIFAVLASPFFVSPFSDFSTNEVSQHLTMKRYYIQSINLSGRDHQKVCLGMSAGL